MITVTQVDGVSIWLGTHIKFSNGVKSPSGKTLIWEVLTEDEHYVLGHVKWFGRWRTYAFFPGEQTVFEKTCLRDIAEFCESQTKIQREQKS